MPLPGNVNPRDRFQRAAYYEALLPEPKNEREAVAGMFGIARNVSVPFGAPYESFGIYNTEYRTVLNLTDRRYYFELTTSPNVIWADLTRMDMSAGAPALTLNPNDIALSGDVTGNFKPSKAAFWSRATSVTFKRPPCSVTAALVPAIPNREAPRRNDSRLILLRAVRGNASPDDGSPEQGAAMRFVRSSRADAVDELAGAARERGGLPAEIGGGG
jgi:Linear amide C-N hydrolases, choloylglycine hydrolase family